MNIFVKLFPNHRRGTPTSVSSFIKLILVEGF
jgi:hypothetical protein